MQSPVFKYLGIIFDAKCLWKQQVDYISQRCTKRINFMRTISGTSWGAHPETMLLLYKSTIRSVLEYGCSAYQHMAETHKMRLRIIQNRGLRTCLGLLSSTHIGSLEAISGTLPIDLRWRYLTEKHTLKNLSGPSKQLRESLTRLANIDPHHQRIAAARDWLEMTTGNNFPCYSFPLKEVLFIPKISWAMKEVMDGTTNLSAIEIRAKFALATTQMQPATIVYTDGSQSTHGTGAAVHVDNGRPISCRLKQPASVFDAELCAILLAVKHIRTQRPGKYVIASDSMSVIAALNNNELSTKTSMALGKCRSVLCILKNNYFDITLLWTPAHVGIGGNERADELAKDAAISATETPYATEWHSRVPPLKKKILLLWQQRWTAGELGRFCHSIIPRVGLQIWSKKLDEATERAEIRTAFRIISNHYTLNNHLNRFSITDTALCTCGAYQTVDHILFDCADTSRDRQTLLNTLQSLGYRRPLETRHILATTNSGKLLKCIYEFLKRNNFKL